MRDMRDIKTINALQSHCQPRLGAIVSCRALKQIWEVSTPLTCTSDLNIDLEVRNFSNESTSRYTIYLLVMG